jgi:hypothetical protein
MSLVRIPWQTGLYVHEDLLVKLEQIKDRLGRPPLLYGPLSGWRSYAEQEALYEAYLAGKGNVASNPETGNRTHMRGVASDLRDQSQTMQRACIAVGLQRDPAEAWHWQLPNWRDYPIIPELQDNDSDDTEDEDMRPIAFQRTTNGDEWLLAAPWLVGRDDKQQGYIVTTDSSTGTAWLRMYAKGSGSNGVNREGYIAIQDQARALRAQWLANGNPWAGGTSGTAPAVDPAAIASAVDAALKDDFATVNANVNKPRTVQ